jgi:serine/threonine protein phosphatase PrpC
VCFGTFNLVLPLHTQSRNKASENEDAVFPADSHGSVNGNNERVSFAVADGATQTSFSGLCGFLSCKAMLTNPSI